MNVLTRFFSLVTDFGSLFVFLSGRNARNMNEQARYNSGVMHERNFEYPNSTLEDFEPT